MLAHPHLNHNADIAPGRRDMRRERRREGALEHLFDEGLDDLPVDDGVEAPLGHELQRVLTEGGLHDGGGGVAEDDPVCDLVENAVVEAVQVEEGGRGGEDERYDAVVDLPAVRDGCAGERGPAFGEGECGGGRVGGRLWSSMVCC